MYGETLLCAPTVTITSTNMQTLLFSYFGTAGDLPMALLKHARESLEAQNKEVKKVFDVQFLKDLNYVAENTQTFNHKKAKTTLRNMMRPKI